VQCARPDTNTAPLAMRILRHVRALLWIDIPPEFDGTSSR
jgi:hypothetical protein